MLIYIFGERMAVIGFNSEFYAAVTLPSPKTLTSSKEYAASYGVANSLFLYYYDLVWVSSFTKSVVFLRSNINKTLILGVELNTIYELTVLTEALPNYCTSSFIF